VNADAGVAGLLPDGFATDGGGIEHQTVIELDGSDLSYPPLAFGDVVGKPRGPQIDVTRRAANAAISTPPLRTK